jgi:hypothetical protein
LGISAVSLSGSLPFNPFSFLGTGIGIGKFCFGTSTVDVFSFGWLLASLAAVFTCGLVSVSEIVTSCIAGEAFAFGVTTWLVFSAIALTGVVIASPGAGFWSLSFGTTAAGFLGVTGSIGMAGRTGAISAAALKTPGRLSKSDGRDNPGGTVGVVRCDCSRLRVDVSTGSMPSFPKSILGSASTPLWLRLGSGSVEDELARTQTIHNLNAIGGDGMQYISKGSVGGYE